MSLLLRELSAYKKSILLLLITVVVTTLCSMLIPAFFQRIVDDAIPKQSYELVFKYVGYMFLCVVLLLFAGFGTAHYSARIAMGIGHNVREKVFDKVMGFSQQEVDDFTIASLITRTNTDAQNIQFFAALSLSVAITAPAMCVIGIVMAVSTSPELTRVLYVTIPVLIVVMAVLGRMAVPLADVIQKRLDRINMVIREKIAGARVIRAFCTSEYEQDRFDKVNVDYTQLSKKMMRITGAFMPVISIVLAGTIIGIFYVACQMSFAGNADITTGKVLALMSYAIYIMTSVILLSVVFLLLPRTLTSANRIKEVLNSKNLIIDAENGVKATDQRGYLEYRNVSFRYAGADRAAVNNLSFKTGPGQTTAIIGGTGMGKSTIINMIPRLYDATEGQILLDGVDVRDWDLDELRARIGYVPQKANLFKGTIESNLKLGASDPTEEAIEYAVQVAQSWDFVMKKKGAFEAPVAQGGSNFSGGQKQRLCIARALVRTPEVYVFDDSFSALDFKTDKALRTALKERTAREGATTIIVAQRVNTIMDADQIIVIDRGDIMGIGTHNELLETCEVYREIVESQMKKGGE